MKFMTSKRTSVRDKQEARSEEARSLLLNQLKKNIQKIETSGRADDGQVISTGCPALDEVLPENGYPRGTIVEWMAGRRRFSGGSGADFLALLAAKNACSEGGALVIADLHRQFNPPAAAAMGIDLGNAIVLRPELDESIASEQTLSEQDQSEIDRFYWAIDQSLRCPAVAAVWAVLGEVHERWFRRFQLSAESTGCIGLFVRPESMIRQPSWAEIQWHVKSRAGRDRDSKPGAFSRDFQSTDSILKNSLAHPGTAANPKTRWALPRSASQLLELELTRCRGARTGQKVQLKIDTITGSVCEIRKRSDHEPKHHEAMPLPMASQLADSAASGRKARA